MKRKLEETAKPSKRVTKEAIQATVILDDGITNLSFTHLKKKMALQKVISLRASQIRLDGATGYIPIELAHDLSVCEAYFSPSRNLRGGSGTHAEDILVLSRLQPFLKSKMNDIIRFILRRNKGRKYDYETLDELSAMVVNDNELLLKIFKRGLYPCPDRFWTNRPLMYQVLRRDARHLEILDRHLGMDEDFYIQFFGEIDSFDRSYCRDFFFYAPSWIKENERIMRAAIRHNGTAIKYCNHRALMSDPEMVNLALRADPDNMCLIRKDVVMPRELEIIVALSASLRVLTLSDAVRNDKELMFDLICKRVDLIKFAPDTMRTDRDFLLRVAAVNSLIVSHIDKDSLADREFVLNLVRAFSNNVVAAAILVEWRGDEEIMDIILEKEPTLFSCVDKNLLSERSFVIKHLDRCDIKLSLLSPPLRGDRELVRELVRKRPDNYAHASYELKSDVDIALMALHHSLISVEHGQLLSENLEFILAYLEKSQNILRVVPDSIILKYGARFMDTIHKGGSYCDRTTSERLTRLLGLYSNDMDIIERLCSEDSYSFLDIITKMGNVESVLFKLARERPVLLCRHLIELRKPLNSRLMGVIAESGADIPGIPLGLLTEDVALEITAACHYYLLPQEIFTENFLKKAVLVNPSIIKQLPPSGHVDHLETSIVMTLARINPSSLSHFLSSRVYHRDFVTYLALNNREALHYLQCNWVDYADEYESSLPRKHVIQHFNHTDRNSLFDYGGPITSNEYFQIVTTMGPFESHLRSVAVEFPPHSLNLFSISMVGRRPTLLAFLPVEYRNDPHVLLQFVTTFGAYNASFIGEALKENDEFIWKMLEWDPACYTHLDNAVKERKSVMLKALSLPSCPPISIPEEAMSDVSFMLDCIAFDDEIIHSIWESGKIPLDHQILTEALNRNIRVSEHCEMFNGPECYHVRNASTVFFYCPSLISSTRLMQDKNCFIWVEYEKEEAISIVRKDPSLYRYLTPEYRDDPDVIRLFIKGSKLGVAEILSLFKSLKQCVDFLLEHHLMNDGIISKLALDEDLLVRAVAESNLSRGLQSIYKSGFNGPEKRSIRKRLLLEAGFIAGSVSESDLFDRLNYLERHIGSTLL